MNKMEIVEKKDAPIVIDITGKFTVNSLNKIIKTLRCYRDELKVAKKIESNIEAVSDLKTKFEKDFKELFKKYFN